MHRPRKLPITRRGARRRGTAAIVPLLAALVLMAGPASAETKVDVATMFRINGCNEYKVAKVAEIEATDERLYVAWCAALTNYLAVIDCKHGACKPLKEPETRSPPTVDRGLQHPRLPTRRFR